MRILIVEDEPTITHFIRQGLMEANYTVDVVGDGKDALDYALATEYDALVLDILLPRLDGLQILQALRGRGKENTRPTFDRARFPKSSRFVGSRADAHALTA